MRQKRVREESRIEVGSGSDSVVGTQECTWRETCGTTKSAQIFRSRMRSRTLVISHPNDALHFVSTFPLQALEPARRRTANSAERNLTAVMAVPHPGLWEKSAASIGSNGSTHQGVSRKSRRRSTGYAMHATTMMATGRRGSQTCANTCRNCGRARSRNMRPHPAPKNQG
jgi:hypothetical protein